MSPEQYPIQLAKEEMEKASLQQGVLTLEERSYHVQRAIAWGLIAVAEELISRSPAKG